jgi:hypothetical protein
MTESSKAAVEHALEALIGETEREVELIAGDNYTAFFRLHGILNNKTLNITSCSVPVSNDKAIKQSLTAMAIDVGGTTNLATFLLDNGLTALY